MEAPNYYPLEEKQELPLKYEVTQTGHTIICDANNAVIAKLGVLTFSKRHADFIVKASNSYYQDKEIIKEITECCKDMIELLEENLNTISNKKRVDLILKVTKDALAKAEQTIKEKK